MSKLDDLFGKKKEVVPVLDLSKTTATTKEDFKRLFEKVPDYKMRPIKVRSDEIKIKDKDSSQFKMPRKELKKLMKNNGEREIFYQYLDPIPTEMRGLVILELCTVPIDWRMLTTMRPKTKLEEEFYSKLVDLGKLQLKTEARDKRDNTIQSAIKKVKNKSGIIETRAYTCNECSEEFCNGKSCADFNYDLFTRVASPKVANKKIENVLITSPKKISNKSSTHKPRGRSKKVKGQGDKGNESDGGASKKLGKKRTKSMDKNKKN